MNGIGLSMTFEDFSWVRTPSLPFELHSTDTLGPSEVLAIKSFFQGNDLLLMSSWLLLPKEDLYGGFLSFIQIQIQIWTLCTTSKTIQWVGTPLKMKGD